MKGSPRGLAIAASVFCVLTLGSAAHAALPVAALERVKVAPPPHAALPSTLILRDASGRPFRLVDPADPMPRVLIFADYACTTLCGPALTIVGARLHETGLHAGRDYRLEVVALDPHSTPAEAAAFGAARLPSDIPAALLTGEAPAVASATAALGYGYTYDPATRAFAHPVAAFVLTADGRLSRAVSEVALTAPDLRAAIFDAQGGAAPGLVSVITLACHGALEALGRFDGTIIVGLRVGAVLALIAGGGGLLMLARRRRAPS